MSKNILVVAAHSDDEAFGCGATMALHAARGDKVFVVFMTNGVGSRNAGQDALDRRKIAAKSACEIIGATIVKTFDYPDNKMDSIALLDIVQSLEFVIQKVQPEIIYTHHIGDLNIDHQVTHKALITACRPLPGFCVKEIYAFEVLSSSEWQSPGVGAFVPRVFIDITPFIELKCKMLNIYKEELREPPHTRSIKNIRNLSALRGNAVGVDYAEAFDLIRLIK